MKLSVFDLFKIGIGPSSSHTVGPMHAAQRFLTALRASGQLAHVDRVRSELFGSLGATGRGHGSDIAVLLGLMGEHPETTDTSTVKARCQQVRDSKRLALGGEHDIDFIEAQDLILHNRRSLPYHANGMQFCALDADKQVLLTKVYYSVGGGFVVDEGAAAQDDPLIEDPTEIPYPFSSGAELLAQCKQHGLSISTLVMANETAWRSEAEVRSGILTIWRAMQSCVEAGCRNEGILPGGLRVKRRAAGLYRQLRSEQPSQAPLGTMDWVNLYALAVNEENAAGGRIVTAPTNGAAGIIPAVMLYFARHCCHADEQEVEDGIVRFFLAAAAIGFLFKMNASISGAEVGCQGEIGSACSMAAAGLTEALGGTPAQAENAAEIGIEHNLGLTCDPIGGLVQIPCIERNAMGAVKAINASRMAMRGDGEHHVPLDKAITTMRETGKDMKTKYKETARGGLALHVLDVPVTVVEC